MGDLDAFLVIIFISNNKNLIWVFDKALVTEGLVYSSSTLSIFLIKSLDELTSFTSMTEQRDFFHLDKH